MATSIKRLQRTLKRLRASGLTWQQIGDQIETNRGTVYRMATGSWLPSEERAEEILQKLPRRLFWEGRDDLDALVLGFLETGVRMTGRRLGSLMGTDGRTIRYSIKRLREKGHHIDASMAPPRGYKLL